MFCILIYQSCRQIHATYIPQDQFLETKLSSLITLASIFFFMYGISFGLESFKKKNIALALDSATHYCRVQ